MAVLFELSEIVPLQLPFSECISNMRELDVGSDMRAGRPLVGFERILCGKRDAPLMPPRFCRMSYNQNKKINKKNIGVFITRYLNGWKHLTICLMAMSSEFFEIFRPNPLLSEPGPAGFCTSTGLDWCPLPENEDTFEGPSLNLLRLTTGTDTFLCAGAVATCSGCEGPELRIVNVPGRTRPADVGLSGSFVLKFGGVSLGKSGISRG